jgi:CubicO group peptidase (beta-lactamase class C family)
MTATALIEAMGKAIDVPDVVLGAATIDPDGSTIEFAPEVPDPRMRFEIGSVTKTMTATLLALLVGEGELSLDEEIGRRLAAGDNAGITVAQLATHTSGLPSMSPHMRAGLARYPENPWYGYDFARAEADLGRTARSDGTWAYSNLGYQLLGLVVERVGGLSYESLLAERILEPLGMRDSRVGHADDGLLLQGRGSEGPVGLRDHPLGAGGVEATLGDLASYARACLSPPATPLGAAIKLALTPRVRTGPDTQQALGWLVRGNTVYEHSGATAGFTACVSLAPECGRAVALLATYGGSIGFASHLKSAAMLALAGRDPSRAHAPQPYPGWREAVLEIVAALLAEDFEHVHERFAPARREKTSPAMLEAAWRRATAEAGAVGTGAVTMLHGDVAATGAVVADVEVGFSVQPQRVRVGVLPDGMIGGLSLLPVRG